MIKKLNNEKPQLNDIIDEEMLSEMLIENTEDSDDDLSEFSKYYIIKLILDNISRSIPQ